MTMQTFGPYTPASGTPIKLTIPIDAAWLYVYNDSPLSLLAQYDGNAPTAVTSLDGAYHFAVRPHSDPVIPVQKRGVSPLERQLNGIAQFGGVVYLMPRDPGGLASSGSISQRAEIFIVAGGPYDAPPTPSSTQRQTDISSQPRVIGVPPAVQAHFSGSHNLSTGSVFDFAPTNFGETFNGLTVIGYITDWHFSCGTAGVSVNWALNLVGLNGALVQQTSSPIVSYTHYGQGSRELAFYQCPWAAILCNANISVIHFQFQCLSISAANTGCYFSFGATLDTNINNQIPVPVIGGGGPLGVASGIPLF